MKEIKLTKGLIALIDDEDFEKINKFTWNANKHGRTFRALQTLNKIRGKRQYMHRMIMPPPEGMYIVHIDENGLNNQKENLMLATKEQTMQKRASYRNQTGYKGVSKKQGGGFIARIISCKKKYHVGTFDTAKDAAKAYNQKAIELHGKFANLNMIEP